MFGPSHIIVSCKNMKTLQEIKSTTQTEHSKRGRLTLPLFDFVLPDRETKKNYDCRDYTRRSTIIFLISAIALAGFRPFGQVWAQFMIVWQR
ncbi:hypothetical protein BKD03_12340 [Brucella sp. 09RB8471]|nr:hypothetical protein BKD03_12340 [Brucella sp. 09RB8471]